MTGFCCELESVDVCETLGDCDRRNENWAFVEQDVTTSLEADHLELLPSVLQLFTAKESLVEELPTHVRVADDDTFLQFLELLADLLALQKFQEKKF